MNSSRVIDPRLYLLIDPQQCRLDTPAAVAAAAIRGGATLVQLRDKTASTKDLLATALALREALDGAAPLLINDRIDIVLAANADGVHIGQDDMPPAKARELLGPEAIIGLTVRSLEEAQNAPLEVIDYLSIGGVFATTSKDNPNAAIGLAGLGRIAIWLREHCKLPLCAISGIDHDNAAAVIRRGVDGIAVISAICADAEPGRAARELRAIVDTALKQRTNP